jgi:ferredoxin-fold anticodon binding domain-containing protein
MTVRTLHGNDIATLALDHLSNHVVNQTMLVPDTSSFEVLLVLRLVNLLEYILELSIVGLEDGVLGAHVQRQLLVDGHLEGSVGET